MTKLEPMDLAGVTGGMHFNPDAKLDPSTVDDYRRGQPLRSKIRAWWTHARGGR